MDFFLSDIRNLNHLGLSTSVHKEWISVHAELDQWPAGSILCRLLSTWDLSRWDPPPHPKIPSLRCSELFSLTPLPILSQLISSRWDHWKRELCLLSPLRDSLPSDSSQPPSMSQASPLLRISSVRKEGSGCVSMALFISHERESPLGVIH